MGQPRGARRTGRSGYYPVTPPQPAVRKKTNGRLPLLAAFPTPGAAPIREDDDRHVGFQGTDDATVFPMDRPAATPTWPVAAGSLVVGFVVAQLTGVRPLGGLVLIVGAAWCARRWRARAGTARTVGLLAIYLACFVASHVIADPVGTWPAVAIVAAVTGLSAWAVADAPRRVPAPAARTL